MSSWRVSRSHFELKGSAPVFTQPLLADGWPGLGGEVGGLLDIALKRYAQNQCFSTPFPWLPS